MDRTEFIAELQDPQVRAVVGSAVERAVRAYLAGLLTEPMTVSELAGWFDVNRDTMAKVLAGMPGVDRFGGRYRLPLAKMPPRYLIDRGLLPSG